MNVIFLHFFLTKQWSSSAYLSGVHGGPMSVLRTALNVILCRLDPFGKNELMANRSCATSRSMSCLLLSTKWGGCVDSFRIRIPIPCRRCADLSIPLPRAAFNPDGRLPAVSVRGRPGKGPHGARHGVHQHRKTCEEGRWQDVL